MRILFVENHDVFANTVQVTFLADHDVTVVPRVDEAVALLEQDTTFDVVLVDYDLDDTKGDELVRWIRDRKVHVQVIGVSARPEGNTALLQAGADAVCPKTEFSSITEILERLVGTRRA